MKLVHFCLALLALALLFFVGLSSRPLFTPDEGRYAEIAREMVVRQDYITPYLNDIKYFEKPALFYWLGAAAIQIGGTTIAAVRTVNALLGILGVWFIYLAGRRLYNTMTGVLAAAILATSTLYFVMAHMVSLDLPVTVFLMGCLFSCLFALKHPTQYRYFYLAALFSALAVLTKGLIGLVFPAMVVGTWIILMNQWQLLIRLPIISGLLVFFLIATPWHVLVNQHNPEFFNFYFIEQHFLRYTDPEIGHYQPVWFFIPVLIAGFFPWIVFLPQTIWNSLRQSRDELFLGLWATLVFLFFSFSKSKLIPYILPVLPPLALLTARYLTVAMTRPRKIGLYAGLVLLLALATVVTYYLWHLAIPLSEPPRAMFYIYAATSCLWLGTACSILLVRKYIKTAVTLLVSSAALFLILIHLSVQFIDTRSVRPLAETLLPLLNEGDVVVTYNQYFQDLPFYLQRRVTILNWQNELTFGMKHQDTKDWMINNGQFFKLWRGKQRVFMVMSMEEFVLFRKRHPKDAIILIDQTPKNVLVTNRSDTE